MQNIEVKKRDWYTYYLYFYIFITPWDFSKAQLSITSIILILWAIIKYKSLVYLKLKEMYKFLPLLLLFLFFIYSYISTLWSDPFIKGIEHVNNFYKYYLLFIPAFLIALDQEKAKAALKVLIISFGIYAIYSILIYFGIFNSQNLYFLNQAENGFTSNNPNGHLRYLIVCQYMVIAFFSSVFIAYYSSNKKEKVLFIVISFLSFLGLFINNSRTAQVSFICILFIVSLLFFKKKILNIKVLLGLCIVFISIGFFLHQSNKFQRYIVAYNEAKEAFEKNTYEGSFGLRLYLTKTGLKIFKDNILLGTGPKDNRMILMDIARIDPNYKGAKNEKDLLNHFHSEQMDLLTAYGLIGYSLLFFSVFFLIYKLRNDRLYFYASFSVFLTLFINSFANKTLALKPLNNVYIIFFILFAIIAYKNENEKKVENS